MEWTNCNGEPIVDDALLAYIFEFCSKFACPWVRFERRLMDHGALLKLLPTVGSVSKKTQDNFAHMVQHAALRLASYDMERIAGMISSCEKVSYAL